MEGEHNIQIQHAHIKAVVKVTMMTHCRVTVAVLFCETDAVRESTPCQTGLLISHRVGLSQG